MNRLAKLEEALAHPEAFFAVFNSLKDLPSAEVREIAREFTKRSARSKADALNRIWARHFDLMTAVAKAKSVDGRSAA